MKNALAALILAILATPLSGRAQNSVSWNPTQLQVTRADLEDLLDRLEGVARSPGYSGRFREEAARDASVIRERLEMGDFRVGDRVLLTVEGETNIPDTLPVQPGQRITLPIIGDISLAGVLRSEIEDHLTKELGRYIQNPVVHARSLVRLSIFGEVGSPGFYTMPADLILEEALTRAGGPTRGAKLQEMRIERRDERIWEGDRLAEAMNRGFTLDQLNLRAGDEIFIPTTQRSVWWTVGRVALVVGSTVFLGIRLQQVF